MIESLAIDYGGVLAFDYCEPFQSAIAKELKISVKQSKAFLSEKSEHGAAYRLDSISKEMFWNEVARLSDFKGRINYDYLQLLWAKTYVLDLRVYRLLKEIKKQTSIKLCLITNSDRLRSEYAEGTYQLRELFDMILSSWSYKVIKPKQQAFITLKKIVDLENNPEKILFIDDRASTVSAGVAEGITGYVYRNYNSLAKFIQKRLNVF
jgi:HAD superfamily hydrolase (TIGR01509 family)